MTTVAKLLLALIILATQDKPDRGLEPDDNDYKSDQLRRGYFKL